MKSEKSKQHPCAGGKSQFCPFLVEVVTDRSCRVDMGPDLAVAVVQRHDVEMDELYLGHFKAKALHHL